MRTRTLVVLISGAFFVALYVYVNIVTPKKITRDLKTHGAESLEDTSK